MIKHKISVLVFCYNQEHVIRRTIDSLIQQKDYIYEICVSDDCSRDNTWGILKEYEQQYPELFNLYRHKENVGIFRNFEHLWTLPTGSLIYRLAGDDMVPDGWFKTVSEFIDNNHIDYINNRTAIYGDYLCKYPAGDELRCRNNAIRYPVNSLRLAIRGFVYNRSCVYSASILQCFFRCSQDRSYIAEYAQDYQLQFFTEKAYYIPQVGNIYFTRIGVNTTLLSNPQRRLEREEVKEYARKKLVEHGAVFCKKDNYYFKYSTATARLYRTKNIVSYLRVIYYYIMSFDFSFKSKNLRILKRALFAIIRRFPHNKPLKWIV